MQSGSRNNNYLALSFDYKFEYTDDEVSIAYCVPYTYSEMLKDIK